jgi:hypothetical protein
MLSMLLTLSHLASKVAFTIWQGGWRATPKRTIIAKVKTILWLSMLLTLSHVASKVAVTIWQGGCKATPKRTTLAKVKTICG